MRIINFMIKFTPFSPISPLIPLENIAIFTDFLTFPDGTKREHWAKVDQLFLAFWTDFLSNIFPN